MRYFITLVLMLILVGVMIQIHELGHALAAISFGKPVEFIDIGIRLFPYFETSFRGIPVHISPWLIGGGTGIAKETLASLRPLDQIAILLAGPFTNLLAVVLAYFMTRAIEPGFRKIPLRIFIKGTRAYISKIARVKGSGFVGPIGIIDIGVRTLLSGGLVGALALWVSLNLGIGLINLIPLHPLDGGRILVILLTVALGDLKYADSVIKIVEAAMFSIVMGSFVMIMVGDIFRRK